MLGASTDGMNPFGNKNTNQHMARVCMDVQPPPMEVHEDKVHTHEHADSRVETTGI